MKLLFGVDPVNWVNTEEQLHKYVPLEKALRCFDSNALDILEKMLPLMATCTKICKEKRKMINLVMIVLHVFALLFFMPALLVTIPVHLALVKLM